MRTQLITFAICFLSASLVSATNEYPTMDRVDHVLTCMKREGGQNVDNMWACSCEIDVIAQKMSYDEFSEARTYEVYKRMPGEKGGLFRDNEQGRIMVESLETAREEARRRCFVGKKKVQAAGQGS